MPGDCRPAARRHAAVRAPDGSSTRRAGSGPRSASPLHGPKSTTSSGRSRAARLSTDPLAPRWYPPPSSTPPPHRRWPWATLATQPGRRRRPPGDVGRGANPPLPRRWRGAARCSRHDPQPRRAIGRDELAIGLRSAFATIRGSELGWTQGEQRRCRSDRIQVTGTTASVALVAVAFAIAGCGGSAAATAPAAVSGSTQSAPPAASAAAIASTGGQAAGATSQAAAANGGTVKTESVTPSACVTCSPWPRWPPSPASRSPLAKEDDTADYKLYSCSYTSTNGTSGVDVSVLALDAAAGFDSGLQADSSAKLISGLGDKAFSAILGVEALFGNVQIPCPTCSRPTRRSP